ncbi:MAG: hypothetical protein HOP19_15495, partial [Acidobacteria bacterium]|nr:hypothetical protein [Acidobacteriota bacterium]
MKKIVVMFAVMLSLALAGNAQEMMGAKKKGAKPKKMTLTGNIIDKACSAKMTSAEAAAGHKKG